MSEFLSVTPYLLVEDARKALAFYKEAFGAKILEWFEMPDGKIGHAHVAIGNAKIMFAEKCHESEVYTVLPPSSVKGTSVGLHVDVTDVDQAFERAIRAGGETLVPVYNTFYGHRFGQLRDPFGHIWTMSKQIENLTPQEIEQRAKEFFATISSG